MAWSCAMPRRDDGTGCGWVADSGGDGLEGGRRVSLGAMQDDNRLFLGRPPFLLQRAGAPIPSHPIASRAVPIHPVSRSSVASWLTNGRRLPCLALVVQLPPSWHPCAVLCDGGQTAGD